MAKSSSSKKSTIQPKRSVHSSSIDVNGKKSSTVINKGTDIMNQSNKKNKNIQNDELKMKQERIVTMEALQNLSDDDEDDDDGPLPPESEWTKEALALKAAIEAGKFDAIVQQSNSKNNDNNDNDESSFEEVDLETDEDEDDNDDDDEDVVAAEQPVESKKRKSKGDSNEEEAADDDDDDEIENDEDENNEEDDEDEDDEEDDNENGAENLDYDDNENDDEEDDDDEEEEDVEENDKKSKIKVKNNSVIDENVDGQDVAENDDDDIEDDDDDDEEQELAENDLSGTKALRVVTASLMLEKKDWSWSEKFDIIPPTPLPFNKDVGPTKSGAAVPATNPLGIHDDLQREVAFYDVALDAVIQAKLLCQKAGIPFTRPDDFFAEMVKTDDHMAKVKDRLIFEGKKIEAVAQRKSNKEHKLRAKETQSNKLAEKAKKKREHMQAVNDWAESAKANRGTNDNTNIPTNKKRAYLDQKFGHGGKRGRFKQNDPQSMNDMSAFNKKLGTFTNQPKTKHGNTRAKAGSGANRKGKRARDASRSRSR